MEATDERTSCVLEMLSKQQKNSEVVTAQHVGRGSHETQTSRGTWCEGRGGARPKRCTAHTRLSGRTKAPWGRKGLTSALKAELELWNERLAWQLESGISLLFQLGSRISLPLWFNFLAYEMGK